MCVRREAGVRSRSRLERGGEKKEQVRRRSRRLGPYFRNRSNVHTEEMRAREGEFSGNAGFGRLRGDIIRKTGLERQVGAGGWG